MALTTVSLVLVVVPVLAAMLGLLMRGDPQALRLWLLLAMIISLGTIGWVSGTVPAHSGGLILLSLLPLMGFATLLGQPLHGHNVGAWLLMPLLLGLGLGVLTSEAPLSLVFFLLLFVVIGLLLFHYRNHTERVAWWGIGMVGLGALSIVVALIAPTSVSSIALAIACAIALPLAPLHKSYVAALTDLPGSLPAFLVLVLPVTSVHGLLTVLPQLPDVLIRIVEMLALVGMLYGSVKAMSQSRAAPVVAYGSLAFLSIVWWYLAATRAAVPQTMVYLSAVGLATGGLLLAWYMLRARYGEIGLRALSGLAQGMPRFAVVLSLLALAALGLPPFGVFSGFLGMLLAPVFTWSGSVLIVIIAWLSASWYLFDLVQGMLFGRPRPDGGHEDLRDPELASLTIVLVLLVALGVMPSRFFDRNPADQHRTAVKEWAAWSK